MINILLYISIGIISISYIGYFLLIMFSNKKIVDSNGFDITKDIISEYNSINVIESKNYFSVYNIKRKVIKLNSKCYYGNKLNDISLSLMEAGISVVDNKKNKYIDLFRKIFTNLKILYVFPIITIFINNVTYTVSDAKVSIVLVIIFSMFSYMLYDIKCSAFLWINDNIKKIKDISKDNSIKVINFINRILWLDKFIFIAQLIMIFRCVLIILNMN